MTVQLSRRTYAITLFLILLVCYGYFMPKWADWGANSRANLVYALGDKGVLYIDDYHTNTGDKACFPGPFEPDPLDPNNPNKGKCNGHYYMDKSLGPSLVALPFYIVFKTLESLPPVQSLIDRAKNMGGLSSTLNPEGKAAASPEDLRRNVREGMALTFITFFATSVPAALLGVVVFLMAARLTSQTSHAFLVGIIYGLATIAFPYSNVLYQHQLSAFGAFVGFYLLWRVIYENASLRWLWLVGVLFSLTVISEYPLVPVLGILFLWAVYMLPNRLQLYRVVLGAVPLGLIFAAYNYAIFQTPLPAGYEYSTNWQGVHQTGFLSLTFPNPQTLIGLTVSPFRGLFFLSPVLVLGFIGLWLLWKQFPKYRSATAAMTLSIAFMFLYNSSSVMWWGGNTVGPRYLAPMSPFLALPIVCVLKVWLPRRVTAILTIILITLSFLNVWIQTIAGQAFPPEALEKGVLMRNPLFEYSLPLLQQGNIARNYGIIAGLSGYLSLIPLLAAVLGIYWLLPRWLARREQNHLHNASQFEKATTGGTR
jgi:hypothetical protein